MKNNPPAGTIVPREKKTEYTQGKNTVIEMKKRHDGKLASIRHA